MWKKQHWPVLVLLNYHLFLWQKVLVYISRKGDNRKIEEQIKYKHKIKIITEVHDESKKRPKAQEIGDSSIQNSKRTLKKLGFFFIYIKKLASLQTS